MSRYNVDSQPKPQTISSRDDPFSRSWQDPSRSIEDLQSKINYTLDRQSRLIEELNAEDSRGPRPLVESSSAAGTRTSSRAASPLRSALRSSPERERFRDRSKSPDPRSIEMKELIADEESVNLLRQQLAQVQQIKIDSERKDMMIMDLRNQVTDLLRYKDQAFNLRAQLGILEERTKLKEAESQQKTNEMQTRLKQHEDMEKSLRSQLLHMEETRLETNRKSNAQLQDLEAQLSALKADAERREVARQKLEYELTITAKNSRTSQEAAQEREASNANLTRRLQEQIVSLSADKRDFEEKNRTMALTIEQLRRDILDKQNSISAIQAEKEATERARSDQAHVIARMQTELTKLTDKLQACEQEASLVPELRKEIGLVPLLRADLRNANIEKSELIEELEREREHLKILEEDKRSLENLSVELERQVKDLVNTYAGIKTPSAELQEKRRQLEFYTKELDRYRVTIQNLRDEIDEKKRESSDAERKLDVVSTEMTGEVNALQRAIENVMSGGDFPRDLDVSSMLSHSNGLRTVTSGLRSRISGMLSEVCTLRDRLRALQQENDAQTNKIQAKDLERAEIHKELLETRKRLVDQQLVVRSLEADRLQLEAANSELSKRTRDLDADVQLRNQLLESVYKDLADPSRSASFPQARELRSFEDLQAALSDEVIYVVSQRASSKAQIADLKAKLQDLSNKYDEARSSLQESIKKEVRLQQELEQTRIRMEDTHRFEMDQQRESLVSDHMQRLKRMDSELTDLKRENGQLAASSKKLNMANEILAKDLRRSEAERDQLFTGCRILAQCIRGFRFRVRDLQDQKRFLAKQVSKLEKLQKEVHDLMQAITGEFQTNDPQQDSSFTSRHASFRVAAIAVIARNRLLRLLRGRRIADIAIIGREKIFLAGPETISSDKDIPSIIEVPADSDALLSLIAHFDIASEGEEVVSPRSPLVDDLSRGLKDFRLMRSLRAGTFRSPSAGSSEETAVGDRGIAVIRKAALSISKRLRIVERERNILQREVAEFQDQSQREQQRISNLQASLNKSQEIVSMLDSRVSELQSDSFRLVPPEKYETLRRDYDDLLSKKAALDSDKERLRKELETKLSAISELRQQLLICQDQLRDRTSALDKLNREFKEKTDELTSIHAYVKRKAQETQAIDEEKKTKAQQLADCQNRLEIAIADTENLRQRLHLAEGDLEDSRQMITKLEVQVVDLERHRQEDEERIRQLTADIKKKERDMATTQDMIKSLTDAHRNATEHAVDLDRKLSQSKQEVATLRSDLQAANAREEAEKQDRQQWARARLELLTMRSAAQSELANALSNTRRNASPQPNPATATAPTFANYQAGGGSPSMPPGLTPAQEQEELRSYIASLDNTLYQYPQQSASRGAISGDRKSQLRTSQNSPDARPYRTEYMSPQDHGSRLSESFIRHFESGPGY